jgi:hypothetical protein
VAIARWSGEVYGAVLFVSWCVDGDEGESRVDSDVQTYSRVGGTWVASAGSGGEAGGDPLERPGPAFPTTTPSSATSIRSRARRGRVARRHGFAGRGAAFVEVVTSTGSTAAPLDSPVGAFFVTADGSSDAFVRVLAVDHSVLTERRFAPHKGGQAARDSLPMPGSAGSTASP